MAIWRKGYLYQYTGTDWIELDPMQHGDKYMQALNDLLENAPDAAFNNTFCKNLLTNQAFIKYLQALKITLTTITENGVTMRGSIETQNYSPGVSGFKINYDGNVEFNAGKFRGRIEASDGLFKGSLNAGNVFGDNGNLISGRYGGLYVYDSDNYCKINDVKLCGDVIIEGTDRLTEVNFLKVLLQRYQTCTSIAANLFISGRMTYAACSTAIVNALVNINRVPTLKAPLSGTVITETPGSNNTTTYTTYILSAMYRFESTIRLCGMKIHSAIGDGTARELHESAEINLTGNSYLTANFTIL